MRPCSPNACSTPEQSKRCGCWDAPSRLQPWPRTSSSGRAYPSPSASRTRPGPDARRSKVVFVDTAQQGYFRQGKAQNFLDREHISKIIEAYEAFEDVDRFAHVADLEEIQDQRLQPEHQPLRGYDVAGRSDERRGSFSSAPGCRAPPRRGRRKDGRPPGRVRLQPISNM